MLRQWGGAPITLEVGLPEGIGEDPAADVVSAVLTMRRPRLADVLDGLRRAPADDRVRALVVKIGGRRVWAPPGQETPLPPAAVRPPRPATRTPQGALLEFCPRHTARYHPH